MADPHDYDALGADVISVLEAWQDRGVSTTASWIMLLSSACSVAKSLGRTPDEVCRILRDCWEAADNKAAVDAAGGPCKKGAA